MALSINFKRGDTFILQNTIKLDNVAQDITLWTIESKIRQGTAFVDTLTVTKIDAVNGVYQIKKADTSSWPASTSPKSLSMDIQYTLPSGQIISTETFEIACVADVTY